MVDPRAPFPRIGSPSPPLGEGGEFVLVRCRHFGAFDFFFRLAILFDIFYSRDCRSPMKNTSQKVGSRGAGLAGGGESLIYKSFAACQGGDGVRGKRKRRRVKRGDEGTRAAAGCARPLVIFEKVGRVVGLWSGHGAWDMENEKLGTVKNLHTRVRTLRGGPQKRSAGLHRTRVTPAEVVRRTVLCQGQGLGRRGG
jgi:hypothetical protein